MIGQLRTGQVMQLLGLHHGLGATSNPDVVELQKALTALSQAAANPAIDPGPPTGIANANLLVALTAAQQTILSNVDRTTSYLVAAAFAALSVAESSDVEKKVTQYAKSITTAVKAATAYVLAKKTGGATPGGGTPSGGVPATSNPPPPPPAAQAGGALDSVLDLFKTNGKWSPVKVGGAGLLAYLAYTTLFADAKK
jgi:hypothetical protein